ncbi:MAG: hypothetical protein KJO07_02010 [Deltaproteobacteria bacterium]|nr:hypothetical protein [Deltaproteobacteria bacterium]
MLLIACGCKSQPEAAIAPGDAEASFHIEFPSEEVSKKAELLIRERLRAAGARSYQVWRNDTTVKVRVAAVRSAGDVQELLEDSDGKGGGPMAKFASVYPYPSAPTTVRPAKHRDE